jgi:hypothetical protein
VVGEFLKKFTVGIRLFRIRIESSKLGIQLGLILWTTAIHRYTPHRLPIFLCESMRGTFAIMMEEEDGEERENGNTITVPLQVDDLLEQAVPPRPRVLMMIGRGGGGHKASGKAIEAALRQQEEQHSAPALEIEFVDTGSSNPSAQGARCAAVATMLMSCTTRSCGTISSASLACSGAVQESC